MSNYNVYSFFIVIALNRVESDYIKYLIYLIIDFVTLSMLNSLFLNHLYWILILFSKSGGDLGHNNSKTIMLIFSVKTGRLFTVAQKEITSFLKWFSPFHRNLFLPLFRKLTIKSIFRILVGKRNFSIFCHTNWKRLIIGN